MMFEELEKERSCFKQTVLQCLVGNSVAYRYKPKQVLKSDEFASYDHGIKRLIRSEATALDFSYMVCDCSVEERKRLLVVFTAAESMNDFLLDFQLTGEIEGCEGRVHSGTFRRAQQIPIDYFREKIEQEGCEVVFTGHSLGASIAAVVATRLLVSINGDAAKRRKVLFIGFGSPTVADKQFKEFIETHYKNNFYFFRNQNDTVVSTFDFLLRYLHVQERLEEKVLKACLEFINTVLRFEEAITTKLNIDPKLIEIIRQTESKNESYKHFGQLYRLKGDSLLRIKYPDLRFSMTDHFVEHLMETYFNNLIEHTSSSNRTLNNQDVEDFTDFYLPTLFLSFKHDDDASLTENTYSVRIIMNEFDSDVLLSIKCKNTNYITKATLKVNDECFDSFSALNSENSCIISFRIENTKFIEYSNDELILKEKQFKFELVGQFNTLFIVNSVRKEIIMSGLGQKQKAVESMLPDLLYLHAIAYIKIFHNFEDERFKSRASQLETILGEIDAIWKLNGLSMIDKSERKNRESELQQLMWSFFADVNNKKGQRVLFNEISIILGLSFSDSYVNLKDFCKESDLSRLVRHVIPTCYAIRRELSKSKAYKEFLKPSNSVFDIRFAFALALPINLLLMAVSSLIVEYTDEYIYSLKNLFNYETFKKRLDSSLPYAGFYEKAVVEILDNRAYSWLDGQNDKIYKTIRLNRKIRDILLEDYIVGVVGKKKCGKSTFIETMITNADANASAVVGTVAMTPYKVCNSVVFIDYPHFDSTDFGHKLQYIFSRHFFDYTFMLCNAMEKMQSDDTEKLLMLVESHAGKRYTILLNRADDVWREFKEQQDCGNDEMNRLIDEVCKSRQFTVEKDQNRVLLTCLTDIQDFDDGDRIKQTSILLGEKLKKRVYHIVADCIKEETVRGELLNKITVEKASNTKKIEIQNEKGSEKKWCILARDGDVRTHDEQMNSENEIVGSFEELIEHFVSKKIPKPMFQLKSKRDEVMKSIEDFFKFDEQTFIVKNSEE